MSIANFAGEQVQLPSDPQTFRHHIEEDWAGTDDYRWRQLAVLTLVGNGWSIPNIARALKLHKGHVYRVVHAAREQLQHFADDKAAA